jgi:hypothetical protein
LFPLGWLALAACRAAAQGAAYARGELLHTVHTIDSRR